MEMLSIMARSKKKGYLLDGEKQMESKTLAKIVSISIEETDRLLDELRAHGVFSESVDGIIYNRRMAREGEISEIRAEAGSHGGRPEKQNESKTKAKRKQKVFGCESKTKAASISSSISSSIFFEEGVWGGVRDDDISAWSEAYPACDVLGELKKMAEWLKANPDKKKIKYRRFIVNWLARTQDRGGSGSGRGHREPDPPHVGANIKADKSPEYWAEHRRLKATGLEGQALMDTLENKPQEATP
jgi:hypothetical protein